jgi:hypothetical protein
MKDNQTILKSLVVSALLGVGHSASADGTAGFTPLEELAPEQRATYAEQVELLSKSAQIDWDSVVVGVDQEGRMLLRAKTDVNLPEASKPSCWGQ